jgi:hypothetical protein
MRHHRFMHLFGKSRNVPVEVSGLSQTADLEGFAVNPFAALVTPAQAQLYQTAFAMAQQQHETDEEWPMAECWN